MAIIQQEQPEENTFSRGLTLADRVRRLERKGKLEDMSEVTKKKTKQFKFPFKWRRRFSQERKSKFTEQILVLYYNKNAEPYSRTFGRS